MMLDDTLKTIRKSRRAFVPYLMGGYPSREIFHRSVDIVVEQGADALEIGIPFSDPLADGPVIQRAGVHALESGVTPKSCLKLASEVHARHPDLPLLFMAYANSIMQSGGVEFLRESHECGIRGLIVPDRELDVGDEITRQARDANLSLISLLAPTTSVQRASHLLENASGFVYLISLLGVTGAKRKSEVSLDDYAARIRPLTDLPLYIGFGISGREQARNAGRASDGVIVGSALIDALGSGSDPELGELSALCSEIREGLNEV